MDELLKEFINETRDLVEEASKTFLEIDKDPDNLELINELFRAIHTIKGSSGIFEFLSPLNKAVHIAEDVLDKARDGEIKLTSDIVDLYLDLLDQINEWLDEVEENEKLGEDAEDISKDFIEKFSSLLQGEVKQPIQKEGETVPTEDEISKEEEIKISWIEEIADQHRRDIYLSSKKENIIAVEYVPEEGCFFTGDDPILTVKTTPSLLWTKIRYDFPDDVESFDPFICKVNFYILTEADQDEIKEHYLYVEDQININEIPVSSLIFPSGEKIDPDIINGFLEEASSLIKEEKWMELVDRIDVALEIVGEGTYTASCLNWIKTIILSKKEDDFKFIPNFIEAIKTNKFSKTVINEPKVSENIKPKDITDRDIYLCIDLLNTQLKVLSSGEDKETEEGRLNSVRNVIKKIAVFLGKEDLTHLIEEAISNARSGDLSTLGDLISRIKEESGGDIEKKELVEEKVDVKKPETPKSARSIDKAVKAQHTEIKVLKVDKAKIDSLMELVSELVVAKNALPYLARRAEEVFGNREMGRDLKMQYGTINRICEELQNAVMQIRMVPVSHVFQRFPRLVRDLSKKLNKKINLKMEGEDTKADKTVVEDLAEPMVHLIRNSIDHGIESPGERKEKGKPEAGTIILRATQLDDQILIEVIDDGRGIDPEKVKKKAYEKGIISEEELERISDEKALQLILAPGFSTAEKVSELSGRGVGMDVVKTFVENLGGSINILSTKNRGTTVQIYLPLSMAVTRVLTVEVGGELFGVPIENVAETVKIEKNKIKFIKNKEVIVLRERIIPIYYLSKVLGIENSSSNEEEDEELAILILQVKNKDLGLVVDKFHEDIDIILKPLEGVMEKYTLYSGATLLGDGRVLLVINPKEIERWL